MKNRIVYPQMWYDEKFAKCTTATKLVFMYLITNDKLGLTPYHRITDRQILFDTGVDPIQLQVAKDELSALKWCFFYDEWVYHNHACAYVSYGGQPKVIAAKERELLSIPTSVKDYFNPLITRYQPNITRNQKSETNNQKLETSGEEVFEVKGKKMILDGNTMKEVN